MEQDLNQIFQKYIQLLPSRKEGMVVFYLNQWIQLQEIDVYFTRRDIQNAIQKVAKLDGGDSTPQTPRIIHQLLHYFIEKPLGKPQRYQLTEYAKRFLALVENKLNNRLKDVPLKKSFEKYALFKSSDITDIAELNQWFEQGFTDSGREVITDHLEAYKDEVSSLTKELNAILYEEGEDAFSKITSFVDIFEKIGNRAEQIGETFELSNSLNQEIDNVLDFFRQKMNDFKNPTNDSEQEEFNKLKNDYDKALQIQREVNTFFKDINIKFEQITEKTRYAINKFDDLKDNLRYQSKFNINTRRFLKFMLQQAEYSKESPMLSSDFPKKRIVCKPFKFINITHAEFLKPPKQRVSESTKNQVYKKQAQDKMEEKFVAQRKVNKWTAQCKQILLERGKLDFTEYFYLILDEEKDIQIPLMVSHELFRFADNNADFEIVIKKEILDKFRSKDVLTWKTKINHHTHS